MIDIEPQDIGFLIELVITGNADADQFHEVMTRVENDVETAELYQQALAEDQLLEGIIPAAEQKLAQEQAREAEQRRLEQERDLGLGM